MEEAGILEKITRSGFCYPALNQVQSRFARTWRLSMLAKKKLKILESHAQRSLEQRFSRVVIDPFVHAIMEKDRCLVEAALLSEKRIASLDDSVRTHFRDYRDSLPELRSICWVNPGGPTKIHATGFVRERRSNGLELSGTWRIGWRNDSPSSRPGNRP